MERQKVIPLFDRVLVKAGQEQKSDAGIYIPRDASERSQVMTVIATGDVQNVKVGDKVVVAKYAGTEVCIGLEKFLIVKECDLLCRFC